MPNPPMDMQHQESGGVHRRAVVLLMLLLFVTSIANIYTRHQHRLEYVRFSNAVIERDELNIEWNQLLVEESLWSFPHRVEKDATRALAMKMPSAKDIVLLGELGLGESTEGNLSQQRNRQETGGLHD